TLFGRDAVISAYQLAAFRPQLAIETLQVLAVRQATEFDEWRDAEPGKMLHELRTGEMARAGELPHTPYYGSIDVTPLWLILLGETYDWTGDRELVDGIASNAGHCLWSGIVSPERARLVAERLLAPGLFSGWGIRTYAAGQTGYNPIGYHTGTVWPHDTSLIVAGLKRYGFHDESNL